MKPRILKTLKWLGWLALGLAAVYVICLVLSGMALRRARAELVAAGRPMQPEALIPPAVPDLDNAAPLYTAAVQLLKSEPCALVKDASEQNLFGAAGELSSRLVNGTITPEEQGVLDGMFQLKTMQEALGILERGIAKPLCRFPVDWTQGPGILLPHLGAQRGLSRIWAAKAISEARQGKGAEAWKSLRQGLAMAEAVKTEPTLISQLVRMAQYSIALNAMGAVEKVATPDAATATALMAVLKSGEDSAAMVTCMDAERLLMGEWVFASGHLGKIQQWGLDASSPLSRVALACYASFLGLPLRQWDQAAYLMLIGRVTKCMAAPYQRQEMADLEAAENAIPRYFLISRLILPALAKVKVRHTDLLARLRLSSCSLALLQARTADGRFPENLAALAAAGANTTDPFTDKPLLYRPSDQAFVLYSVGENLLDDGGQSPPAAVPGKVSPKALDIVWSYAPAAGR